MEKRLQQISRRSVKQVYSPRIGASGIVPKSTDEDLVAQRRDGDPEAVIDGRSRIRKRPQQMSC